MQCLRAVQACLETGRQQGNSLMQGRALWQLGRLEGHRGKHEEAATLKLDALQRLERVLGKEHLDIAKCCTGESGYMGCSRSESWGAQLECYDSATPQFIVEHVFA